MNDKFTLLDCDDDVMSCFGQTFKLGDFKKRVTQEVSNKLNQYSQNQVFCFLSFSVQHVPIRSSSINWKSTIINCEILMLGHKSWQSGKLRIQVDLESADVLTPTRHNSRETTKVINIQQLCLEFCPDEPEVSETPVRNKPETSKIESSIFRDILQELNETS